MSSQSVTPRPPPRLFLRLRVWWWALKRKRIPPWLSTRVWQSFCEAVRTTLHPRQTIGVATASSALGSEGPPAPRRHVWSVNKLDRLHFFEKSAAAVHCLRLWRRGFGVEELGCGEFRRGVGGCVADVGSGGRRGRGRGRTVQDP